MADFVLKYADGRGQIHQQVTSAGSEKELREQYTQQGFLIYSIKARSGVGGTSVLQRTQEAQPGEVPHLQPAVRHPDPRRPAHPESPGPAGRTPHRPQTRTLRQGRPRRGPRRHPALRGLPPAGNFPQDLRHLRHGRREKRQPHRSLDRYITYQKLSLAVRKKVMVSLMYPCVLIVLVILLMVFLVTYVVPTFATLYTSMQAQLPPMTLYLIAIGTASRKYIVVFAGGARRRHLPLPLVGAARSGEAESGPRQNSACRWWAKSG